MAGLNVQPFYFIQCYTRGVLVCPKLADIWFVLAFLCWQRMFSYVGQKGGLKRKIQPFYYVDKNMFLLTIIIRRK